MKDELQRDEGANRTANGADGNVFEGLGEQERFEEGASRYADYLQTIEGRLRLDLAWLNLRDVLKTQFTSPGRALDAGGGTGALAARLASEGWDVTVVDSSAAMLALASESARRTGGDASARMHFRQADAARVGEIFDPASFDAIVCHNVIEYVEDPRALFASIARVARRGATLSMLARNRAGEVMRDAIKLQNLDAAHNALTAESVRESLYGGPARVFDQSRLRQLADEVGFEVLAERGVRVVADYLPESFFARPAAYTRLIEFERELGARTDFAAVARYTQLLARAARP